MPLWKIYPNLRQNFFQISIFFFFNIFSNFFAIYSRIYSRGSYVEIGILRRNYASWFPTYLRCDISGLGRRVIGIWKKNSKKKSRKKNQKKKLEQKSFKKYSGSLSNEAVTWSWRELTVTKIFLSVSGSWMDRELERDLNVNVINYNKMNPQKS